MSLQNLQVEFLENILTENRIMTQIKYAQNMTIYRNNILTQLVKTLRDIYPLIVALLGEDFFQVIAKEYAKSYPSNHPNLNFYGEYFAHFISEYSSLINFPYLQEVAEFEWICHTLFFAEDVPSFPLDSLKNLTPETYEELHFTINPASRLFKPHYPLLNIIDLCQGKIDTLDINEAGTNLLIIRRYLDIVLTPLTECEFTFLKLLQNEKSLAQALNTCLEIDPNFKLEEKLISWIQDKTIVNFTLYKALDR